MSGIYIHIPFCKQKCTYCDFYTRVAPALIPDFVDAAAHEIDFRADYLEQKNIQTVYFGGGTPSILTNNQFQTIFDAINRNYHIADSAEITFEANPDDLTDNFFKSIEHLPFNRISMGIQTFDDNDLKLINRRHTGRQAIEAVQRAKFYGFENISIDLIYGLPGQTMDRWQLQLQTALDLNVQHVSIYGLTYEPGTRLWKQREKGQVNVVDDDTMLNMYESLLNTMKLYGYEAYEISNFAKPGFRSRHNSAYWHMEPYLGIGPSAHSFNGSSRQWNVGSIAGYIEALKGQKIFFEKEELTENDRFNDYVMVSLRTNEGVDMSYIRERFDNKYITCFEEAVKQYLMSEKMLMKGDFIKLTMSGIHISNMIISDVMYVD